MKLIKIKIEIIEIIEIIKKLLEKDWKKEHQN